MKTYSELKQFTTFDDRFNYLRLNGGVAHETFGHERWINQRFYRSQEWKRIRMRVIARDLGRDLGIEGHDIVKVPQVHHMNPMGVNDIRHFNEDILDPEYLITVSHDTHNAIHYGDIPPSQPLVVERQPNDTTLW